MNIKIIGVSHAVLKEIIKTLGPLSIGRCKPYIDFDRLFFEISIIGKCSIITEGEYVTVCQEDKKISIYRGDFFKIIIL